MTTIPASHSGSTTGRLSVRLTRITGSNVGKLTLFCAAVLLVCSVGFSQTAPKITGVDPGMGKVNDSITVSGANLAKDTVTGIFLSDDKSDYKATIIDQAADKIVMKVPQVKPGSYNVSIQVGNGILIEPVRFTVQQ
jgi:hypothetical protein